jgi:hypothetical protein
MKTTLIVAAAALTASTTAYAQDLTNSDTVNLNPVIEDSFDDNRDYIEDSFDDNRDFVDSFDDNRDFVDSFDDNSDTNTATVRFGGANTFNANAIVAESTLSGVVTGVDVDFGDVSNSAGFDASLSNNGNAFRNYAGMNALNQNTGTGASQNATVTVAASNASLGVN